MTADVRAREVIEATLDSFHDGLRGKKTDAILTALSDAGIQLCQWQPIDTAHRVTRPVLLREGEIVDIGVWEPADHDLTNGYWCWGTGAQANPDAWMPLPSPRALPPRAAQPAPADTPAGAGEEQETT